MGRQIIEHQFLARLPGDIGGSQGQHVQGRPVQGQILAEVAHPGVVLVELGPAGEGPEGYLLLNVDHEG